MSYLRSFVVSVGLALSLALSASVVHAATQCSAKSFREARELLANRLLAAGYSGEQAAFLMSGADRRTSELRADKLSERAKSCGIDSARAHVLLCVGKLLFPLKESKTSLDAEKPVASWGKKRLAGRELLFIGYFNACLGTAKQRIFGG
ncbi:hypothetical protein RFN28_00045 [Mesorhizobium sp. VK24D]|uniref:Uncharacterized protein n=1 Tax=Mesorhizobium album TaxID=3072314 RepID=A0ABU4XQ44_9HYPH|nr:hypothetical protein [Mesorhizobium sp. VK24D]MDX8476860.1 hypothetical protein [Mesorhizobium sp. VK24D]